MEKDIELIPTEDFIAELKNRFDHMVFIGLQNENDNESTIRRHWSGNPHLCVGLATNIQRWILDFVTLTQKPKED